MKSKYGIYSLSINEHNFGMYFLSFIIFTVILSFQTPITMAVLFAFSGSFVAMRNRSFDYPKNIIRLIPMKRTTRNIRDLNSVLRLLPSDASLLFLLFDLIRIKAWVDFSVERFVIILYVILFLILYPRVYNLLLAWTLYIRSEERRVGKEC